MSQALYEVAAFYKSNTPEDGGFDLRTTDAQSADAIQEYLTDLYQKFVSQPIAAQERVLADIPSWLVAAKMLVGKNPLTEDDSKKLMLFGFGSIYILEKQGLIPSDMFNGMQYRTMAEVEAFQSMLQDGLKTGAHIIRYGHDDDCPALDHGSCNCIAEVNVETVRGER
jgi:hypothetical protein